MVFSRAPVPPTPASPHGGPISSYSEDEVRVGELVGRVKIPVADFDHLSLSSAIHKAEGRDPDSPSCPPTSTGTKSIKNRGFFFFKDENIASYLLQEPMAQGEVMICILNPRWVLGTVLRPSVNTGDSPFLLEST